MGSGASASSPCGSCWSVSRISRQLGRKANIVVRINPQQLNRSFAMKMGGKAAQFGIDEEELAPLLEHVVVQL